MGGLGGQRGEGGGLKARGRWKEVGGEREIGRGGKANRKI